MYNIRPRLVYSCGSIFRIKIGAYLCLYFLVALGQFFQSSQVSIGISCQKTILRFRAMDSLIAQADAVLPLGKKRKLYHGKADSKPHSGPSSDRTTTSIVQHTALPKSLRPSDPLPENVATYTHIANKKLRTELTRHSVHAARAANLVKDSELLLTEEAGKMEVEGEMERTWRVSQDEIVKGAGEEAARGRREWKLDGGPYRSRYTRNGR